MARWWTTIALVCGIYCSSLHLVYGVDPNTQSQASSNYTQINNRVRSDKFHYSQILDTYGRPSRSTHNRALSFPGTEVKTPINGVKTPESEDDRSSVKGFSIKVEKTTGNGAPDVTLTAGNSTYTIPGETIPLATRPTARERRQLSKLLQQY